LETAPTFRLRNAGEYAHAAAGEIEEAIGREERPDVLMMAWPYMDEMAIRALRAFKGDRLVYVGDGSGGCTANDGFHDEVDTYWERSGVVGIPQWEGIHDGMYLYQRAAPKPRP
jgi:hypothetical protein